ncbi:MAG: porphobilinogen synthase [Thermoleophilia bacterium]
MYYPTYRMRRLRRTRAMRDMLRETTLSIEDLVHPLVVVAGENVKEPLSAMPGCFQFSIGNLLAEVRESVHVGLRAIYLFGVPSHRDSAATGAYDAEGIVQMAVRAIKDEFPELLVITDVCLCSYMDHGHCGVFQDGEIVNDVTLELLAKTAVTHAESGADIIAPSDMMDGRVAAIRSALDDEGLIDTAIMPSSVTLASAYDDMGALTRRAHPGSGDRRTYQIDCANAEEAVREVLLDIEEGADIVMVKPALLGLDIVRAVKQETRFPLAALSGSGEYAMLRAAALQGWLDERAAALEAATAIKRAGADMIITYHAKDLARWLS